MSIPELHTRRPTTPPGATDGGVDQGSLRQRLHGEVRAARWEGPLAPASGERLRAQLASLSSDRGAGKSTVRCSRCGLTVGPGTVQQDRVLLFAACCPRCDGQLVAADEDDGSAHRGIGEPSIYLG